MDVKRVVLLLASVALAMLLVSSAPPEPASAQALQRPNILFVFTDDLDASTFNKAMPKTKKLIAQEGVTFPNAYFSEPICCPSRASMLRGQYPHNTKVLRNYYPAGGFQKFWERGLHKATYGTVLDQAGYRTFYGGKLMNGYGLSMFGKPKFAPVLPGWDVWRVPFPLPTSDTYRFDDGSTKRFEGSLHDRLVTEWAKNFIRSSSMKNVPFAAVVSLYAPHEPAEYPGSYAGMYRDAKLPTGGSYNESDVSDKPPHIRKRGSISAEEGAELERYFRKRLRSTRFADDMIAQLYNSLKQNGELSNTIIVVWSDNGYHMGEHRMIGKNNHGSKGSPYIEDVRLPLLIRGPGISHGVRREEFVSAVDLLPTFADVANTTEVPSFVDGRSFLPLARGKDIPWRGFGYSEVPGNPGAWNALYTKTHAYHAWNSGDEELYDLSEDPYELANLLAGEGADANAAEAARYRALVEEMSTCQANECREAESTSP
jgi:N-acetylglucosamine-6-sulfatase